MVILFGISFNERASVDVIILSLSILINGKFAGLEPVAITIFFDSIISSDFLFLIFTLFWSIKLPMPLNTSILFLFIKKLIPLTVCSTTEFFLIIIFFKLTFISPDNSIP